MKNFFILLSVCFSVFLFGCSSEGDLPKNIKLAELPSVEGQPDFEIAPNLSCDILVSTEEEKIKSFELYDLDKKNGIVKVKELEVELPLQKIEEGGKLVSYIFFSENWGESFLLFDKSTGVFVLSHLDIWDTAEKKMTSRGNCQSLFNK